MVLAEELNIENASSLRTQELMFAILKQYADLGTNIFGDGTLDIMSDGFGFLRNAHDSYLAGPEDVYVSPSQIRRNGLRTGDTVEGSIRAPREGERYFALTSVAQINFEQPKDLSRRLHFDDLTPLYPDQRLKMEILDSDAKDCTGRVIDIVAPLGKGQRCLIVAPPRVGKTVMMQNIAKALEIEPP